MIQIYTMGICAMCHRTKIRLIFGEMSEQKRRLKLMRAGWGMYAGREFCPKCSAKMMQRAAYDAVINKLQSTLDNAKIKKQRGIHR